MDSYIICKIHQKKDFTTSGIGRKHMRKFRKYTATALVAMMVAGMTMSGYQPADVSASLGKRIYHYNVKDKNHKTVESGRNTIQ